MKNKLKILHLEDMPSDAELVARELKKGKINSEILVVDNKAKFEKALTEFFPDIILSDHSLSSFDSHDALRLVKEAGITVPFILVTAMTDEFAVDIMKEGADDYIIKDRVHRLPSAVINSVEKHRLREEQRAEHERLAFHIENAPLGFIEWDNQLHIKSLSKRAVEMFGWSLKEFAGHERTGYGQVYEEDRPWVFKLSEQLLSGKVERNKVVHRNYTKDGRVIWCEWFNSVLKDNDGKVITIMSLVQDVTERKIIEEKLAHNESRLKEAQAIARVGSWEIDFIENKQTWSDELYNIYGINRDEVQPSIELFFSFMHPDDVEFAQKEVQQVFETSKYASFNFRFIRKDGTVRHGHAEARFEFSKNNKPVRIYGIVQDITEMKIAEEKLAHQNNELLKTNSELDRFVYSVSHDLRAPLSSMLGVIEISQDDTTDERMLENLKMLKANVKKLDEFIAVILEYSRNSRLEVKKEEINFKELLSTITQNLKDMGGNNRLIDIKIDVDDKVCVHSDKSRLNIILNNLISNAIRYQNTGISNPFVAVKIERSGTETGIIISDNGIGIKKELHQKIFDMFYRVSDKSVGSGLGLYIVKETVGKLNGSIDVQSEPGKGSTFIIKIPTLN